MRLTFTLTCSSAGRMLDNDLTNVRGVLLLCLNVGTPHFYQLTSMHVLMYNTKVCVKVSVFDRKTPVLLPQLIM